MKVLVDTHYIIWMAVAPDELKLAERRALDRWRADITVSVVSFWEIRTKWETLDRKGRRKGVISPQATADFLDTIDVDVEPLNRDVVLTTLTSEIDHTDPFDRMLLVHAQYLGAHLLTRDPKLWHHPVAIKA